MNSTRFPEVNGLGPYSVEVSAVPWSSQGT
jgi:hypothetical protein